MMCLGPRPIGCELSPELRRAQMERILRFYPTVLMTGWEPAQVRDALVCDHGAEVSYQELSDAAFDGRNGYDLMDERCLAARLAAEDAHGP